MQTTLFVNVVLPLPVKGYFTYRVPFELNEVVEVGKRVVVQFGKKKIYTALIHNITAEIPKVEAKYILGVVDQQPIVNTLQFNLWEWIASYYCCTLGEVMNAALPSAFKLASESKVSLADHVEFEESVYSEKEYSLLNALKNKGTLTLSQASKHTDLIKIFPLIHTLIEKGAIVTEEKIDEKYTPKLENYVRLAEAYRHEKQLEELYNKLEKRSPKQLELLIKYIQHARFFTDCIEVTQKEITSNDANATAAIKTLQKKGIFEIYHKEISRLQYGIAKADANDIVLTEHQRQAFDEISRSFETKNVVLLHGVTSSGKTEIYIKLIREALNKGQQALYLLPEIALTSQIITRLQKYFGEEVGVYHSKYSENERVEIWQHASAQQERKFNVIIGARSALFLPYQNLGLIITDEEHDASYKQYEPAPRYNARDTAIYLAHLHGAKVLLGSATPAIESFYNATTGKYGLATLSKRYGDISMPNIEIVDLKKAYRKNKGGSVFSEELITAIGSALTNKEQVILFQNRRGFSLHIECKNCNWIPQCVHCDVSLVYHKKQNHLRCHYCGYSVHIPQECPECGHTDIMMKGFGTEKIEEDLAIIFPEAKIARMDLDNTRTKYAHQKLINSFEERKIDILVGTQMVTKGLDFENVSLVGILNADSLLSYPDFRSFERGFQLMAQVAGRAGRKGKQGNVLIQAYNAEHPVLKFVLNHAYESFYESQLQERLRFHYPPFCRIITLSVKHTDADIVNHLASDLANLLRSTFGKKVLGPEYPIVSRIRNQFIKNIIIKLDKDSSLVAAKDDIQHKITSMLSQQQYKSARIVIDVDPA